MLNQNLLLTGDNGYNLTKSLRFRSSASAYLNRTPASAGSSTKMTFSFWTKRGQLSKAFQNLFTSGASAGNGDATIFTSGDAFRFWLNGGSASDITTSQVFRDPSAWYHIVIAIDTTQATASNRVLIYVNGTQVTAFSSVTYPNQNYAVQYFNTTTQQQIGYGVTTGNGGNYYDGYQTEINFIDGQQLTPSSFGSTNALTGVWQPAKYTGTYGTNGFYLPFTDNSATTPVGLGKDFSGNTGTTVVGTTTSGSNSMTVVSLTGIAVGNTVTGLGIPTGTYVTAASVLTVTLSQNATSSNVSQNYNFAGNNWTCNNISLTAGTTYDSMTDVPTLTSATTGNFCTWNPLDTTNPSAIAITNGNLTALGVSATAGKAHGSIIPTSNNKWYWETTVVADSANGYPAIGLEQASDTNAYTYYADGYKNNNGTFTSGLPTMTTGDVVMVAYDASNGKLWFGKNNTWFTSGDPATGANPVMTVSSGLGNLKPTMHTYLSGIGGSVNFGQQGFKYTPPTGFVALNTFNLPEPSIKAGNKYMDATIWSGDNTTPRSIANSGSFQPDFVWIKSRSNAYQHNLYDSVRGAGAAYALSSDQTSAEGGNSNVYGFLSAFNSTGFQVTQGTAGGGGAPNGNAYTNQSGSTYVGWQWKAGNSAGSSNTAGSITSTVSANLTAGFSIVTYNTGSAGNKTVGHGLGVTPAMIIIKSRVSGTAHWDIWHKSFANPGQDYMYLNLTNAVAYDTRNWANTAPTSSVFSFESGYEFGANSNYVAYCWAEIAGYSAFGKYTGNGSADGPFVYTGFRPAFVMIKRSDSSGTDWVTMDNKRLGYNVTDVALNPNASYAENSGYATDFTSNGFKLRTTTSFCNGSGATYIYMAFAENPFKYSLAR